MIGAKIKAYKKEYIILDKIRVYSTSGNVDCYLCKNIEGKVFKVRPEDIDEILQL